MSGEVFEASGGHEEGQVMERFGNPMLLLSLLVIDAVIWVIAGIRIGAL